MKRRMIASIVALCLVFTLSACSPDTVKNVTKSIASAAGVSAVVSGSYSEEPIWRNYHCAYPFIFDEPLASCVGFTMDYNITEVTKGDMTGSRYIMEVYGLTTQGNWKLLDSFYPQGLETTVELAFDPVSIEAVAVICQKQGEYSYSESMTIRDVCYSDTAGDSVQSGTQIEGTFSTPNLYEVPVLPIPLSLPSPWKIARVLQSATKFSIFPVVIWMAISTMPCMFGLRTENGSTPKPSSWMVH